MGDWLLFYARKGFGESLRASAFRKYCRRYRGEQRVAETRYGFRVNCVLGDAVDNQIFVNGLFEPGTSRVIAALAGECGAFVDVGCNIGYFSCFFAAHNAAARVYCVDANPRMVERAEENLKLNGYVGSFINRGVSDGPGELKLYIPKGRHSLSSFAYRPSKGGEIEEVPVAVERLGQIVPFTDLAEVCLKVDTEGFEFNVFSGLTRDEVARIRYVVFECNDDNMQRAGKSARDLFSIPWLEEFHAYTIEDDEPTLRLIDRAAGAFPTSANVLLVNRALGENKAEELGRLASRAQRG